MSGVLHAPLIMKLKLTDIIKNCKGMINPQMRIMTISR